MCPVYTIGTWRVSRSAYLRLFSDLGVRRLVDVRGNPQAGRQEELKRSRDFERALQSNGIKYEYWGKELGEDAVEAAVVDGALDELSKLASRETLCLMGHLHEAQGCHRLLLSDGLADRGLSVKHLLWTDHVSARHMPHAQVMAASREVLRFFTESHTKAEAKRKLLEGSKELTALPTVPWECFDTALFTDGVARRVLLPFDTELLWYPGWLTQSAADKLQRTIEDEVAFYHPTYVFQEPGGGCTKTLIKRGQVRICGEDCPGSLGSHPLQPWSEELLHAVEDAGGAALNCFVANHYANGRVVINWHSDSGPGDDEGLGPNPTIGSLSLGAIRTFSLKSKRKVGGRIVHLDIPLTHGSLLVMGHHSQTHWLHCLPAEETATRERINLTFRFFARQSTKHVEGVEHNHEWETAEGSTRVLLNRDGAGRPVLVDIPKDLEARSLPRFLSSVLPHGRRVAEVSVLGLRGEWRPLAPEEFVAAAASATGGQAQVKVSLGGGGKGGAAVRNTGGDYGGKGGYTRWEGAGGKATGKGWGGKARWSRRTQGESAEQPRRWGR